MLLLALIKLPVIGPVIIAWFPYKIPLALTLPTISNNSPGAVVPIPTLPSVLTVTLVEPWFWIKNLPFVFR